MSISKDFQIFLQGVYVPHVKLHVCYWWFAENFNLRVHLHLRFIRRELLQKTSELRTTNFSLSRLLKKFVLRFKFIGKNPKFEFAFQILIKSVGRSIKRKSYIVVITLQHFKTDFDSATWEVFWLGYTPRFCNWSTLYCFLTMDTVERLILTLLCTF